MKKYAKFIEYDYERNLSGYDFYPICKMYDNGTWIVVKSSIPVNLYKKENPLLYKPGDRLIIKYKDNDFKIIKKSYRHITVPIICLILIIALLVVPMNAIGEDSSIFQVVQTSINNYIK